jgi:hypothetical protein
MTFVTFHVVRILVGRLEENRPIARHTRRWVGNIKMDFKEIGYESFDWIQLARDKIWLQTLVDIIRHFHVT